MEDEVIPGRWMPFGSRRAESFRQEFYLTTDSFQGGLNTDPKYRSFRFICGNNMEWRYMYRHAIQNIASFVSHEGSDWRTKQTADIRHARHRLKEKFCRLCNNSYPIDIGSDKISARVKDRKSWATDIVIWSNSWMTKFRCDITQRWTRERLLSFWIYISIPAVVE